MTIGPTKPRCGELWLIDSFRLAGPRTVVCVVETGKNLASVMLTDNEPDMASDQDICYAAGEVAPWPVRVCADLIGPVRLTLFRKRLGAIPIKRVNLLPMSRLGEFAPHLAARRGIPLRGPADPRWDFALAQLSLAQENWFTPFDEDGPT